MRTRLKGREDRAGGKRKGEGVGGVLKKISPGSSNLPSIPSEVGGAAFATSPSDSSPHPHDVKTNTEGEETNAKTNTEGEETPFPPARSCDTHLLQ